MDGRAAADGGSAPRENGVTATSEAAPAARLPSAKRKPSKTTQPAAVASRPPTAPGGVSKTLNNGPAKKPNVSQTKPLVPKNSAINNTSAPKSTATKSKKAEQPKPTRTWLPGTKNATSSSALSRAPVNDKGIGKPKHTVPPAGQAAAVQQPKTTLTTTRDPTRATTMPKAKLSSTNPAVKKLPATKPLKSANSKLQSEPSLGQKNVTMPKNPRLLEKKLLEAPKPRTPIKTTAGSTRPATPYKTPVPKVLAAGSSPGKKLLKKDSLPSKDQAAAPKKLQKATDQRNAKPAIGEKSLPIEDTKPMELQPTTEVETDAQLLLKESVASRLEAQETEQSVPTDEGGREDRVGCLGTMVPQMSTPILEEVPLVFPSPQHVKVSSPRGRPNLPVPEISELPEETPNLHSELLCQLPSLTHLAPDSQTPPLESVQPCGESTDFQDLKEQALPHSDIPVPPEQLYPLLETALSCEDVCHLSISSLDEDSQILVKEELPVPSCVGGLPSPASLVVFAEEVQPVTLAGMQEETAFQVKQSPSASLVDSPLRIMVEPQTAEDGEGHGGFDKMAKASAQPLYEEEEWQRKVFPVEDETLRMSCTDFEGKVYLNTEGAQELATPQTEELNRAVVLAEDGIVEAQPLEKHPDTSQGVVDKSSLSFPVDAVALLPAESMGDADAGHGGVSGSVGECSCIGGPGGDAVAEVCLGSLKPEDAPKCEEPDPLPRLSGEVSPGSGIGQLSMPKPQTLPLKSLELLQEPPTQLPEAPELLLSCSVLNGHSPERGGSSSKSSTLSGPDLAGKSSSETSTPEELRDYDSSSGVESKSDEKLEQTCHQLLSPLEDLPGELDLGIHMEKGDDEAETLPADEILGDPPTEPTVSSEEEVDLDADLLKDPAFTETVCLSRSPPGKPSLAHSVEESDEPGSGDAGTETPASTNSAASCDVFGAFHLHSTDSCGKSPGLSSLESEEHSTEGSKEPLPKESHSKTPVDWEHPAPATPASQKTRVQDEEASLPFAATHNLAAGDNGAGLPFPWGPCPSEILSTIYEVEGGAETPGLDDEDGSCCSCAASQEQGLHLGSIQATVVQQLISRTLLFSAEAPSGAVGGKGPVNTEAEISKWTELISPLDESRASITSVTSFSPEDMSSPHGDWTVVEVETFH
ncbi:proline-rich protein 36 isoform X2 [Sphaerodactylus townsendi]|uniref:proline-rich protein 36 isoform X2 n=1 Tax=Sphaerodactylus townsendi TaxID=933632 RepID=UPI002026F85E|nr:proline-rich protein 36 isoform X2 [Sphaerodactylus townsendi]